MSNKILIPLLSKIMSTTTSLELLPVSIDNRTKIANYEIDFDGVSYHVSDLQKKQLLHSVWTKMAALALVRNYQRNDKRENEIIDLDYTIGKNLNDVKFYKNTIKKTQDTIKKFSTNTRLQIAKLTIAEAQQKLLTIIFS